jgi:lysophospholipase L1-like esterase
LPCAQDAHKSGIKLLRSGSAEARGLLSTACSEDSIPLRILPEAQDDLRTLFLDEGIPFVDAHSLMSRHKGIDLPAERLFFDHVHLSKKGHEEMSRLISEKLKTMINK